MATECFKIEWTGFYSLSTANSQPEARELGLYAVYKPTSSSKKTLWYIGKATEIGTRLNQHRQEWQQVLTPKELNRLQIAIGVLTSLDGKPVNKGQLTDIESMFRHIYHPKRNDPATMKGYTGRSAFVINIGKRGVFNKLTTHDKNLLKLLKDSLTTRKSPSYYY